MADEDPNQQTNSEGKPDDGIPVLTDIVDPAQPEETGPYVGPEEPEAPEDAPADHHTDIEFDDNFGIEEAAAAGLGAMPDPALPPESPPAPQAPERDLGELRAKLTAELDYAAERIIAESVDSIEALIAERISRHMKEEIRGIVGAAMADFERQRKQ
ncbi:MAG TPA: hypothetical protein VFK45_04320 [Gammaproteobacteria bacterium]|nr:hypothetical protein [Gammaproteobacteria bacterium]